MTRWGMMLGLVFAALLVACGAGVVEPQVAQQPTPQMGAEEDTAEPVAEEPTATVAAEEEPSEDAAVSTEEEVAEPVEQGSTAEPASEDEAAEGEASAQDEVGTLGVERVCLVTEGGGVDDGTYNEFAYHGMLDAAEDFGFETHFIETEAEGDIESNIQTCLDEGYDTIITVGFLSAESTLAMAEANPAVNFIGGDQFFAAPPPNLVGIQSREDQAGFLAGTLACMMTESHIVGGIYGIDVPPLVKFRNGFENGCHYVNPPAQLLGEYMPSFTDPEAGAAVAEEFLAQGADVIFGAGGATGSGGIRAAAEQGAYVIGVDQDEYVTTFDNGSVPGAENLLSSAIKRIDVGIYDQLQGLVEQDRSLWAGGGLYILNAANGGIDYAPFHDAADVIPQAVQDRLEQVRQDLASGALTTGVDLLTGEIVEDEIPEPDPFQP